MTHNPLTGTQCKYTTGIQMISNLNISVILQMETVSSNILDLHGVCLPRRRLSVCKDGPVVAAQHIWKNRNTRKDNDQHPQPSTTTCFSTSTVPTAPLWKIRMKGEQRTGSGTWSRFIQINSRLQISVHRNNDSSASYL